MQVQEYEKDGYSEMQRKNDVECEGEERKLVGQFSLSPVLCCLDVMLLVILNMANCDMVL